MGKMIDLKGQRFGFWIVIERAPKNEKGQTQWLCGCECGNKKIVTTNSLRTGNSTSCGCNHVPNLLNNKFDKLKVIKLDDSKKGGRRYWVCKCECGNLVTTSTYKLRNKLITSCGCETQTIEQSTISNTALSNCLVSYKENIDNLHKNCIALQNDFKILQDKVYSISRLLS